ncbi:hypothetical protein THAOC_21225 [Thalassiosira oceanica]|uniref:Uncharacterized protein n=1 Tax=Thalassiosira oceanica TaxID=159749 RepID=K0S1I5_THAOC|nr:hypothetical protein THAOC_21225 [Thalassiosira oceanica]|eukprot:EJK58634.1 hypothetical protein THAOC_21225 [Thalassiosira oceanica]
MAPPVTYSDNVRLPFDPTDGVPIIEIRAPISEATHVTVYHSDLKITAKDDCDPNPTWEIDTTTLADGQDIPIGTLHLVQVNAKDWKNKVGVGYIKVLAAPSNVCYGSKYYRLVSASDIGEDPALTIIP